MTGVPTARLAGVCVVTGAAGALTVANRAGVVSLTTLAASPHAIAESKVWLLLRSGMIADRPCVPSLLGFAVVGLGVLSLAPLRIVIAAALAGQILATVAFAFGIATLVSWPERHPNADRELAELLAS